MFRAVWDWVHANPASFFFCWALLGGAASVVERHTAQWPRVQRVFGALAGILLDVLKTCQQLQGGGGASSPPPPAPPPPPPEKKPADEPLPPTLRRSWAPMLATALQCFMATSFVLVIAAVVLACASAAKVAAEDAYKAQLLACVEQAKTRAAALACHDRVQAEWGLADAGGDR